MTKKYQGNTMNILEKFAPIETFVMDIDGVLTNGQVFIQNDGTQLRAMDIKDGYALQLAVKKGYQIIVISGASSEPCRMRLQRLGVSHIHIGVGDKAALLLELAENLGIDLDRAVYIGDDMPDMEVMKLCGWKACPADACADIQMLADYISPRNGGTGCVRDVLEKVLRIREDWE